MTATLPSSPRALNRKDFHMLGLAALGGALEFYDFIIFIFFANVLGPLFFPPEMPEWLVMIQTFGIFAAGYLVRPLGGIVMAHFGDRVGRKKMFALSVFIMSAATLGMALLPTYAQIGITAPILLILLRMLQGAAIGGEVPGAWTFVAEHVPSNRVGMATGFLCSGLALGILLGSLIAAGINWLFSTEEVQSYAWRIPFLLGGVFGLLGVYLRRFLSETPVFIAMQSALQQRQKMPVAEVLEKHLHGVIVSALLTWVLSAGVMVTTLMTATFLEKLYGYSALEALLANAFGTLFLLFSCILGGALVDRYGTARFFTLGGIVFALITFLFYRYAGTSLPVLLALYALMGTVVGLVGGVPYVMVRAFPAPVRFSGISLSYNVAYAVFGGLTPLAVTTLMIANPMAPAWYLVFIGLLASAVGLHLYKYGRKIEGHIGLNDYTAGTPE